MKTLLSIYLVLFILAIITFSCAPAPVNEEWVANMAGNPGDTITMTISVTNPVVLANGVQIRGQIAEKVQKGDLLFLGNDNKYHKVPDPRLFSDGKYRAIRKIK